MDRKKIFREMLNLQDSFNNGINQNWSEEEYSFEHAIFVEAGEAGASLEAFKWWKDGINNYNNYKVELIDIWHFHMSLGMKYYSKPYLVNMFTKIWDEASLEDQTNALEKGIRRYEYFMLKAEFEDFKYFNDATYVLFRLFQESNVELLSVTDLYKNYLIKNCLNKVRKDNGYKEGTYIKLWDGENEDNVFAWNLILPLKEENLNFEYIVQLLNQTYKSITQKGKENEK